MAVKEFVVGSRAQREWGWLVILDFFLAGTGAGLFLVALILGFPLGMAAGVGLVLVGAVLLLLDLTRPMSAWRVMARPQDSWMSRGTIGILAFAVLAVVYTVSIAAQPAGWSGVRVGWAGASAGGQTMAVVAGLTALFVALYPGFLLGSMRSVPLWNSAYVPTMFVVASLLSGLGAIFFLPLNWAGQADAIAVVKSLGIGMIILQFVLLAGLAFMEHPQITAQAVRQMTAGSLKMQFYFGALLVGLAIPLALLITLSSASLALLPVTGLLLLVGMFFLRYVIVKAGMYASVA